MAGLFLLLIAIQKLHCKCIKTTINNSNGTCNKLGSITHKIMDSSTKLFGFTHTAKRSLANDSFTASSITAVRISKKSAVLFSQEKAWRNGVYPNTFTKLCSHFSSKESRKIAYACLSCSIAAYTCHRTESCHRREVYNTTLPLFNHRL